MKSFILLTFVFAVLISCEHNLLPRPRFMSTGKMTIKIHRCNLEFSGIKGIEYENILKTHKKMFTLPKKLCQKSENQFPVNIEILESEQKANECFDEMYQIQVEEKKIAITIKCPVGLVHALVTLHQLSEFNEESALIEIKEVPINIKDYPRFSHRGIMIDTSRHYLKKSVIERIIEGMMYAKLNVLHWHIVDDDSFPMESKSYPGLAEKGAFSPNLIYKATDIKEIIDYADARGVRVIPEFDNPGHAHGVGMLETLRDIVTCFNTVWPINIEGLYKIHGGPSPGDLDPSMDKSYEVVKNILKDIVSYFKDPFVHLGGDEVAEECWDERPAIKEFMRKNNIPDYLALQTYYIKRVRDMFTQLDNKKKAVYWSNEDTFKVKYKEEDVLQYWGESKNIKQLISTYPNNQYIMSPYDYFYLDCGLGDNFGGVAWCGDFKTWVKMYLFEPTNFGLKESSVLGGEACAWSEMMNSDNVESRLWPRALSLAETFWEPKRTQEVNLTSLVMRLDAFSKRLNKLDIPTMGITGQYCEIHTHECFQKWT